MSRRLGVFISGRGSNLKSVLESYDCSKLYVFTNKKNAQGLKWAVKRGAHVRVLSLREDSDWERLANTMNKLKIKKILLLGFMKIVPKIFLDIFNGDVINLHPSLLPDFPGLNSIAESLEAKKSVGVSLHHVTENMDEGPLIYKCSLPLNNNFSKKDETLRIHSLEQHVVSCHLRLGVTT